MGGEMTFLPAFSKEQYPYYHDIPTRFDCRPRRKLVDFRTLAHRRYGIPSNSQLFQGLVVMFRCDMETRNCAVPVAEDDGNDLGDSDL